MPAFYLSQLIHTQRVPNAQTTLFTAGQITRIDAIAITNTDTATHTISINLVASGGAAAASNLTTQAQLIQPGQTWNSPNEVGKVLGLQDFISVLADAANVLNITAGGVFMTV